MRLGRTLSGTWKVRKEKTSPSERLIADESECRSDDGKSDVQDDGLDNEGKNELYWIHLMEYEQTQLRKAYAARMQQLHEAWDVEVKDDVLKQDMQRRDVLGADCEMDRWYREGGIPKTRYYYLHGIEENIIE